MAVPLLVLLPLALAVLSFGASERLARAVAPFGAAAVLATVLVVLWRSRAETPYALGGWPAPLAITLLVDGVSRGCLLLTASVFVAVLGYARWYFDADSRAATRFWPLAWLLWAALDAVFISADLFNLYIALELLTLAAVGLAAITSDRAAVAAALRYLLTALVASNLFLLAIALLYQTTTVLDLATIGARLAAGPGAMAALALVASAMAVKSALAPLHGWLPPAHASAPAPVSALLSALVVKASFVILLRTWLQVAPVVDAAGLGRLLSFFGAVTVVWGALGAALEHSVKRLVAYSTVGQVGYLFMVFAWLLPGSPVLGLALEAVVLQLMAHGLAKSAMFLATGTLVAAARRDDIAALEGAAAREPLAIFGFGLAGASLIGLPPSAGFAAKWQLLQVSIGAGDWLAAAVVILGGLLASVYVFRVLRLAFLPTPSHIDTAAVPRALGLIAFLLALVAGLGGLGAGPLMRALALPTATLMTR